MNSERFSFSLNLFPAFSFPAARLYLVLAGVLFIGACAEKDIPLPGERISVLNEGQTLGLDSDASKIPVRLPRPAINESWPQAGGQPDHVMGHPAAPGSLKVLWSKGAGSGSSNKERLLSPPIVGGGRVFTIDVDSEINAFDAESGKHLWDVDIVPDEEDDISLGGGLAYEEGRVFATAGFAQVVALDAENGEEIWRQAMPGPMRAAPTVREGKVYIVTIDNQAVALSAEDGKKLWTHSGIEEATGVLGGASPAISKDVVVVPYTSGEIYALREGSGRPLWSDNLSGFDKLDAVSSLGDIRARPAIVDGKIYAISHGGRMVALDLRTGFRIWERALGGIESPWVAGEFIYVLTSDSALVCLTRGEGHVVWISRLQVYEDIEDEEDLIVWAGPILAGNRLLVVGSTGVMLSLSPYTGLPLGQVELPDPVIMAPVVANSTIYILTNDAELIALR